MGTFTIIGTVCSIIGVPIALWQSISAKSKAKAAQEAVKSVLEKAQISIYSEIIEKGHKVENALNAQRGKDKPQFGKRLSSTIKEIDSLITYLNEKKNNITDTSKREKIDFAFRTLNECRKNFDDNNPKLKDDIERILQQTQVIIAIASEEKQGREYK